MTLTIIIHTGLSYIPSFKAIGPVVLEKKIFKGFTIFGHGGHLGHVT